MKIEYNFKKFFTHYSIIGAFVQHTELWAKLAFYTVILLNIMIFYSYTENKINATDTEEYLNENAGKTFD